MAGRSVGPSSAPATKPVGAVTGIRRSTKRAVLGSFDAEVPFGQCGIRVRSYQSRREADAGAHDGRRARGLEPNGSEARQHVTSAVEQLRRAAIDSFERAVRDRRHAAVRQRHRSYQFSVIYEVWQRVANRKAENARRRAHYHESCALVRHEVARQPIAADDREERCRHRGGRAYYGTAVIGGGAHTARCGVAAASLRRRASPDASLRRRAGVAGECVACVVLYGTAAQRTAARRAASHQWPRPSHQQRVAHRVATRFLACQSRCSQLESAQCVTVKHSYQLCKRGRSQCLRH